MFALVLLKEVGVFRVHVGSHFIIFLASPHSLDDFLLSWPLSAAAWPRGTCLLTGFASVGVFVFLLVHLVLWLVPGWSFVLARLFRFFWTLVVWGTADGISRHGSGVGFLTVHFSYPLLSLVVNVFWVLSWVVGRLWLCPLCLTICWVKGCT